jgi:hypothetical protein
MQIAAANQHEQLISLFVDGVSIDPAAAEPAG